jgi:hypothetical protein
MDVPPGARDGAVARSQTHNVDRHGTIEGSGIAEPGDQGLQPGELQLRGYWLGSSASDLADRLRAILDDATVRKVDLSTVGTTSRYDGTYRIAEKSAVGQVAPGRDGAWEYSIRLIEINV